MTTSNKNIIIKNSSPKYNSPPQNDSIDTFEDFFREYYKSLVQFATYFLKNLHSAEDTVQDVFYQVWNNKEKLNEIHNLKTYLFTAVKNNSLKKIRKLKPKHILGYPSAINKESVHFIELNFDAASAEDLIEEKVLRKAIEDTINRLPKKCKLIFCMHRFEDLTYKEIAEIQSISIKTVETQISRAIKLIRKRILPLLTIIFSLVI